jgi:hypothetical protein
MVKIFNQRFTDTIWSLGYWGEPEHIKVWIETRNKESNTWYSFDLKQIHVTEIANKPAKALNWLTGLSDAGVFLQLKQGKNPGIEKLLCYNLPSGELRYSFNLNQWTSLEGNFLVTNQGTIDLISGKLTNQNQVGRSEIHIESPLHFEESQEEFKAFETLFNQKFGEKIGKGIDYWEGSNKLIFSYYIYENAWKNKLRICDYAFQTQFIETIAEGNQMGYHTFQCIGNKLIFIKDKHEINIYADH